MTALLTRMPVATSFKRKKSTADNGILNGYRSGLEDAVAAELDAKGISYTYEQTKVAYTTPAKPHKYTPDFVLWNGVVVETKGRFLTADRQKHLLVKQQHPELDIRFVFSRSKTTISKTSKTTYGDWCLKYGFQYADKSIPDAWLKEKPSTSKK